MPSYTIEAGPPAARPQLERAPATYGVMPNLLGGFIAAGYGEAQMLEVVLGIALKTLSNDANHLTGTPLDPMFEATPWSAGDGVADD